ncbi:MAG: hypothetical protein HY080_05770 [Gammaproteobacteria bacterium]|nr:hypothetical protein [Gammaproteobacteria bacterium]
MRYITTWILGAVLVLSACGGGGSSGNSSGPTSPPAPPASGTPTATITNSPTVATNLTKISTTGLKAVLSADKLGTVPLANLLGGPMITAKTTAVGATTAGNSVSCGVNGGTMNFTFMVNNTTTLSAGDSVTIVFTDCAFVAGTRLNGSINITFTRYIDATNYAFNLTTSNFTSTSANLTNGPYNYTGSFDLNNNIITSAFNVDGVTVVGQPVVSVNGSQSTTSGTVHIDYASAGWIECVYSNWVVDNTTGKPLSGTITITAANGDSAVITVVGSHYQVAITINGVLTSYLVPL